MSPHLFAFEKLDVWKDARALLLLVYGVTELFPAKERFVLISQMNRAMLSVVSNIAEGSARTTFKDQAYFTKISYSSLMELLCQLIIALDLGYVDELAYTKLRNEIEKVSNKLNALRKYQLGKE